VKTFVYFTKFIFRGKDIQPRKSPLPPIQVQNAFKHSVETTRVFVNYSVIILKIPREPENLNSSTSHHSSEFHSFSISVEPDPGKAFLFSANCLEQAKANFIELSHERLALPAHNQVYEFLGEFNRIEKFSPGSLGGFENHIGTLESMLEGVLQTTSWKKQLFKTPLPPLAIIAGKHGSGKSALAKSIMWKFTNAEDFAFTFTIQFESLIHRNIHTLQRYIGEVVQLAQLNQPSIILFENIDSIITTDQQGEYTLLADQLAEFIVDTISESSAKVHRIAFLLTCGNSSQLHKTFRSASVMNSLIELLAPSFKQRVEILQKLVLQKHLRAPDEEQIDFELIAKKCEGYYPADLEQLLQRTVQQSYLRQMQTPHLGDFHPDLISQQDIHQALQNFTPASLKGIQFVKSETSWDQIGGMADAKSLLLETFYWPTKYHYLFDKCPLKLRRG
jgi:peroxin-1